MNRCGIRSRLFWSSLPASIVSKPEDKQVLVADKFAVVRPSRFVVVEAGECSDILHEYEVCDHSKGCVVVLLTEESDLTETAR